MAMDSDGEREDDEEGQKTLFELTEQPSNSFKADPGDEIDGGRLSMPRPRARVTSMVIKHHIEYYIQQM